MAKRYTNLSMPPNLGQGIEWVLARDYDALAAQHDLTVQLLAEAEQDRDYWKSLVKKTPRTTDNAKVLWECTCVHSRHNDTGAWTTTHNPECPAHGYAQR